MTRLLYSIAAAALLIVANSATAADIKVFGSVGVQAVLEELQPKFEQATGHKLVISWETAAVLAKRVHDGDQADALILTKGNVDALLKAGKIAAHTST